MITKKSQKELTVFDLKCGLKLFKIDIKGNSPRVVKATICWFAEHQPLLPRMFHNWDIEVDNEIVTLNEGTICDQFFPTVEAAKKAAIHDLQNIINRNRFEGKDICKKTKQLLVEVKGL